MDLGSSSSTFLSVVRGRFLAQPLFTVTHFINMRSSTAAAALAAGLLPTAVMGAAAWLDVCSVDDVLEYFTCQKPVPAGCVDGLAEQAMAWCSNYLSIKPVTVYVSTETPVFTETVTQTTTSMTTTTVVM
jgi:hypothetical protein